MTPTESELKRELERVDNLLAALDPSGSFVEDMVCLQLHRKALSAALAIQQEQGNSAQAAP